MGVFCVLCVRCFMCSSVVFVFVLSVVVVVWLVNVVLMVSVVWLSVMLVFCFSMRNILCVMRFVWVMMLFSGFGSYVILREIGDWFSNCMWCNFVMGVLGVSCNVCVILVGVGMVCNFSMWLWMVWFCVDIVLVKFCSVVVFWNVLGWLINVFFLWWWKISFLFCRLVNVWCMVMWLVLNCLFSVVFEGSSDVGV